MSLHGDDSSDDGAEIVVGTQADRLKRPAEDEASAGGYVGGTEADGDADDDGDMSMEIDGGVGTRPESGSITPGYASTPTAGSTTRSGARHGLHVNMTSKRPAASAAATQTPLSFTIDDPEGDEKIDSEGNLLGGRQFLCKTFFLPEKDQTLYLLATEVARITGYRDSYLLFHKNKHLFKLMTNDAEKQMMIAQEAIPNSYRNRPIGVVDARSIYKTFGARMVLRGRRVLDDYYAQRARDEGFTEDDLAHEEEKPAPEPETRRGGGATYERDAMFEHTGPTLPATDFNTQLSKERREREALRRQHFYPDLYRDQVKEEGPSAEQSAPDAI